VGGSVGNTLPQTRIVLRNEGNRAAQRDVGLQQALEFHERFFVEEGLLDIFEPDAAIVETWRDRPPGRMHHASHA